MLSPAALSILTDDLRRGRRAQPRARRLGRRGRLRRRRRRAARRRADRVPRLGVGPVRQRPDRARRRRDDLAPAAREPRRPGARHFDVAGAVSITAGLSLLVYALVDAVDAGWGSTADDRPDRDRAGADRGVRRHRAALQAPADPVLDLPQAHADRRQRRRRCWSRCRCSRMFFFVSLYMQQVLGYDALKAGVAYLPLAVGIIVSAGVASQLVTKVGFKPVMIAGSCSSPPGSRGSRRCRRRHLRRRRAVPVAAGRRRARALVRAADDRRGRRGSAAGGRAGERADQHLPAGRRRARPGHPRDDRELDHAGRDGRRRRRPERTARGADRRLPGRLHRRRRLRDPRRAPDRRADLQPHQPRARRGGAPRRGRGRAGPPPSAAATPARPRRSAPPGSAAGPTGALPGPPGSAPR